MVLSRHTSTKFYENPFSHSPRSTSGQIDITDLKDGHSFATVLRKEGEKPPMEIFTMPLIRTYAEDGDISCCSSMCL